MSLQSTSVLNTGAKKEIISSSSSGPYVAQGDWYGNGRVTDATGMTDFSPNVYRLTTIMDRFIAVGGNDSKYVQGDKETRVSNGDIMVMVGPSEALNKSAYTRWAEKFSKIASSNLIPPTEIEAYPIIPGYDINNP